MTRNSPKADRNRAFMKQADRERALQALRRASLPDDDRKIISALIDGKEAAPPKHDVHDEAHHVAVFYFDYLRALALKKAGRKRLTYQRKQVAEDAITLTRPLYPSANLTVALLIGEDGSQGLVDGNRVESMRPHFNRIAITSGIAPDVYRLPRDRLALYHSVRHDVDDEETARA